MSVENTDYFTQAEIDWLKSKGCNPQSTPTEPAEPATNPAPAEDSEALTQEEIDWLNSVKNKNNGNK